MPELPSKSPQKSPQGFLPRNSITHAIKIRGMHGQLRQHVAEISGVTAQLRPDGHMLLSVGSPEPEDFKLLWIAMHGRRRL